MDCKEFMRLLHDYTEERLPQDDAARMRTHEEECSRCAAHVQLLRDCRALNRDVQAPEEYASSWREKILEEERMEKKSFSGWKKWAAAAAALVFVVGGTLATRDQMGAPENNQNAPMVAMYNRAMTKESNYALGAAYDYTADTAAAKEEALQEEKIIRTANFTIKTLEYDRDLARIQVLCEEFGGRVEYLYTRGDRENGELYTASLRLRIPSARLDDFLTGAQGVGRMTSRWEEVEDVSGNYYDVKARLDVQLQKMERLQALLVSAENVTDLIAIESSIADAQYMIDLYQGQLQNYDSRIDYSTVNVTVQEIKPQEAEDIPLGQRISAGIKTSVQNGIEFIRDAVVFLISVSPWLAGIAMVTLPIILAVKRKNKRKNSN